MVIQSQQAVHDTRETARHALTYQQSQFMEAANRFESEAREVHNLEMEQSRIMLNMNHGSALNNAAATIREGNQQLQQLRLSMTQAEHNMQLQRQDMQFPVDDIRDALQACGCNAQAYRLACAQKQTTFQSLTCLLYTS